MIWGIENFDPLGSILGGSFCLVPTYQPHSRIVGAGGSGRVKLGTCVRAARWEFGGKVAKVRVCKPTDIWATTELVIVLTDTRWRRESRSTMKLAYLS